jgi:hypothetical protein
MECLASVAGLDGARSAGGPDVTGVCVWVRLWCVCEEEGICR